jgi:hypothetical protein
LQPGGAGRYITTALDLPSHDQNNKSSTSIKPHYLHLSAGSFNSQSKLALQIRSTSNTTYITMADSTTTKYILYHYNPSFVAAVIFIALFALSSLLHLFQLIRKRTWYFIPFLIGGFCKLFQKPSWREPS